VDPGADRLLVAISERANEGGVAKVPLRQLAARLEIAPSSVQQQLVRLERAKQLNVIGAPKGPDGRRGTNTYQITLGPWAKLWRAPGVLRSGPQETFDKRNAAIPERRPRLEEQLGGERHGARAARRKAAVDNGDARADARAGDPLRRARREPRDARAETRAQEVLSSTSKGAPSVQGAPPLVTANGPITVSDAIFLPGTGWVRRP